MSYEAPRQDRIDGRVAHLPEALLTHPAVGVDEIAVLTILALHTDLNGLSWPSQGLVARFCGRSRSWVNKVLARLAAAGLITKIRRYRRDGGEKSCHYVIPALSGLWETLGNIDDSSYPSRHTPCAGGNTEQNPDEHPGLAHSTAPPSNEDSYRSPNTANDDDLEKGIGALEIVSETWSPSPNTIKEALARFPDVDLHAEADRFRLKSRARGYRYRNHDAAWMLWLQEDHGAAKTNTGLRKSQRNSRDPSPGAGARMAAWAAAAAARSPQPSPFSA